MTKRKSPNLNTAYGRRRARQEAIEKKKEPVPHVEIIPEDPKPEGKAHPILLLGALAVLALCFIIAGKGIKRFNA